MNTKEKELLIKYLFPTEEIRKFLINDIYQEFNEFLPKENLFNERNMKTEQRLNNYNQYCSLIKDYLNNHSDYLKEVYGVYHNINIESLIDDLLMGYVFYLSEIDDKLQKFDIFKDKKSICFTEISILDVM